MDVSDMDLDSFIDLETRVWDALRHGDVEEDMRLLAEDFLGVYSIGFAGRSDHAGQLANGPTVAEFELHDARLMVLSDNDALLFVSRGMASARRRQARPTRVDVRQFPLVPTPRPMAECLQSGLSGGK